METAKRYNEGKNRIGLVPAYSIEQIARVFTVGAEKYGADNYRKGMKWSKCVDSLERHLNAFKQGIDYDEETNLLHLAHAATNIMFLIEYTQIYPQGDDRIYKLERLENDNKGTDTEEDK